MKMADKEEDEELYCVSRRVISTSGRRMPIYKDDIQK
jgi:hypothetical protein